jgi:putative addiction module killer protein
MIPSFYIVEEFELANGRRPYRIWVRSLDKPVGARVQRRIRRFEFGDFGISRHFGNNLYEAKLDIGPGFRVYFGKWENRLVLLLCGGDKSTQSRDIEKAMGYWRGWTNEKTKK